VSAPLPPGQKAPNAAAASPLISVVICTHNRAEWLGGAIQSALDQHLPSGGFEVVVVDNASSDRTRETVEPFLENGRVRYVHEGRLGLCNARNTVWQSARGQYIAFLDDDAVACPGWLAAVAEAFSTTPAPGVVGGRVDPIWEGPRPPWLSDDLAGGLAVLDWSDRSHLITDVRLEWLAGVNLALPVSVLAEVGGFHPWLDRVGARMLSSGDVFLQKQVIGRGYPCLYCPKMAVRHRVPASRLSKPWFYRRYFWQGVSDAVMQIIEEHPSRLDRIRQAAGKAVGLLANPRRLADLLRSTDEPDLLTRKCFALIPVGHAAGLLGLARH
jgi:glycosyltransferase involved in cell wall biosynthesis